MSNGRRFADVELVMLDPARNARRYYAIRVERSLFERALVVWRGRLDTDGNVAWKLVRREPYESDAALARRYDELRATRRRHGYVEMTKKPARAPRKRCPCGGLASCELRAQGQEPRIACHMCASAAPFTTHVRAIGSRGMTRLELLLLVVATLAAGLALLTAGRGAPTMHVGGPLELDASAR